MVKVNSTVQSCSFPIQTRLPQLVAPWLVDQAIQAQTPPADDLVGIKRNGHFERMAGQSIHYRRVHTNKLNVYRNR